MIEECSKINFLVFLFPGTNTHENYIFPMEKEAPEISLFFNVYEHSGAIHPKHYTYTAFMHQHSWHKILCFLNATVC